MLSHHNIIGQCLQLKQLQADAHAYKILAVMPLFHSKSPFDTSQQELTLVSHWPCAVLPLSNSHEWGFNNAAFIQHAINARGNCQIQG